MATEYTGEVVPLKEYTGEVVPLKEYAGEVVPADQARDPTTGMSTFERVAAGAGKAVYDIGRGVGQRLGMVSEKDIAESRKLDEPLMRTTAGKAGEIAGGVAAAIPAAMALPATGVAGSIALGGALGAAQPTVGDESVGANIATGAAFGLGGALAPRALASVVKPKAAERQAEALGRLTPGQALGGAYKTAEEKATSLPFAGPMVAKAQRESIENWNKGVLNKVLEPIGQKTDKFGHEGVEEVSKKLSQAYDNLLPKLNIQVDNTFDAEMKNLRQMATNLAEPQAKQFEQILGPAGLGRKITQHGKMSGESMKEMDRELGRLSRLYGKAEDPDKQELGNALREAQASLRSLVERSNPQHADELRNINQGWARLIRVENAASKTGAKEGVFTPAQLNQAARATDTSLRHKQFSHGKALFQYIATQAEKTIGNVYPDPGTAGRLMSHPAAALASLPIDLPVAAAYGIPQARHALASAFTKRPRGAKKLAEGLRRKASATGKAGAIAGTTESEEEQPEPRAEGGSVIAGKTYLVGENGPEVIVANQNGQVIPNSLLASEETTSPQQTNMPAPYPFSLMPLNYDYVQDFPITGSPTAPSMNEADSGGLNIPLTERGQLSVNVSPAYSSSDLMYQLWKNKQMQLYGQVGTDTDLQNYAGLVLNRNF